jgi:nucleoside-diphosphate-sugar epimerase
LKAIQEHNPDIRRVVITGSFASVLDPSKGMRPGYAYTEADWNPVTAEEAKSNGVFAYLASKTFAEQAAWQYVKDNKVSEMAKILQNIFQACVSFWQLY